MTPQQKRQEILDAAAREFIDSGYAATTLSSVAGRLGLTKGALAHHFPTKDALLVDLGEALRDAIHQAESVTREAYPNGGIHAAVVYMLHLAATAAQRVQVAATLVLLTDRGAPPNVFAELVFEWLDHLKVFFDEAQIAGELDADVDTEEFAQFMLATNIGSTLLPSKEQPPRNRRKRFQFMRLGLRSLGVERVDQIIDEILASPATSSLEISEWAPKRTSGTGSEQR